MNTAVQFEPASNAATCAVALDAGRWTRAWERKLAIAQRTGNKTRTRAIHAKIKSQRMDALHKFTSNLVRGSAAIFVGDVSSLKLAKTRMAKSVLDSGWGMLKQFLEYKSHWAGTVFEVVDERNTTVKCSNCGQHTGPEGLKDLAMKEWVGMGCGTAHDRDVNVARNIFAAGHRCLSGEIPFL